MEAASTKSRCLVKPITGIHGSIQETGGDTFNNLQWRLLILDELGYVPFSKTGAELFFEGVSRAYEGPA
jgi:DNA replication protein DnaC